MMSGMVRQEGGRWGRGRFRCFYRTDLGWGGVITSTTGLLEVIVPFAGSGREELAALLLERYPQAVGEDMLARKAAAALTAYFSGVAMAIVLPLDWTGFTPFRRLVSETVQRIPAGEARSYAQVAREVGSPGAARGVGSVMARNPLPIVVPCHRVVATDGALTGFSAPGGVASKEWLLRHEGLAVLAGKVAHQGK